MGKKGSNSLRTALSSDSTGMFGSFSFENPVQEDVSTRPLAVTRNEVDVLGGGGEDEQSENPLG